MNIRGSFDKFSESPPEVSTSVTSFPRNNDSSFSSKHAARQCSVLRSEVQPLIICCCRVVVCEDGKIRDSSGDKVLRKKKV